jgi:hypothetical protein
MLDVKRNGGCLVFVINVQRERTSSVAMHGLGIAVDVPSIQPWKAARHVLCPLLVSRMQTVPRRPACTSV